MREFVVTSSTPAFADKGASWFVRHARDITQKGQQSSFWKRNTLIIREFSPVGIGHIAEQLIALGYERTQETPTRGTFAVIGGTLRVSPINVPLIFSIEWNGNIIERIWKGARSDEGRPIKRSLEDTLAENDYVVHRDHGIGQWNGITVDRGKRYYLISYAPPAGTSAPDMLAVPVTEHERITPYIGFRTPSVHRLGTPAWKTTLKHAEEDARVFAEHLIRIAATRETAIRSPYNIEGDADRALINTFGYEPTETQERATEEIFHDLTRGRPMERLLLGDVGFGKTDVAIRTTLQAVLSGRQVAVLTPTTVLVDQHAETFSKKLSAFPISVARLSRLESAKETTHILAKLRDGSLDVVVGTHRILSSDVTFKNLGLLIIDEEQRFGVEAKEALKKHFPALDILTLSATPLPRTLSLALSGLRDLTRIELPPEGRIAPHTIVVPYAKDVVKEVITREMARGGQTYFLANRIRHIADLEKELTELIPRLRVGVLHARLPEQAVIKTMHAFRNGAFDVLISTTIIENGIDLTNANTLIVHNASLLGLADMHQLRGRIGRGHAESYAYFCYPRALDGARAEIRRTNAEERGKRTNDRLLRDSASSQRRSARDPAMSRTWARLATILETAYLGSGDVIAERDMELRGAGNVLGKAQSGTASRIGLNLYSQLLAEAVERTSRK